MKIHVWRKDLKEIEELLKKNKIPYKTEEEKHRGYKEYINPVLPVCTYNKDLYENHIIIEVKKTDWKKEHYLLFGKKETCNQSYLHYGEYSIFYERSVKSPLEKGINYLQSFPLPKYPIFIISYKRSYLLRTMKHMEEMKIQYYIVIKEKEKEVYEKQLRQRKFKYYCLLCMDKIFEEEEEKKGNFGSIPQRNFC